MKNMLTLEVGETHRISVDSKKRFNPGLSVQEGQVYLLTTTDETWKDGKTSENDQRYFECTAADWPSDRELSWTERIIMRALEFGLSKKLAQVRVLDAEYFELCACFDQDDSTAFRIGSHPSPVE